MIKPKYLFLLLSLLLFLPVSLKADKKGDLPQATVDSRGNVVFTLIVEGLPLNASEAVDAAENYLATEYKTSRYSDIQRPSDKNFVLGKGNLESFYTDSGLAKSKIYSADYFLRFDGKDGMTRIQVVFNRLKMLQLSDAGNRIETEVRMSEVQPFAESDNGRSYKKAHVRLQEAVSEIFESASNAMKSANPTPVADEW